MPALLFGLCVVALIAFLCGLFYVMREHDRERERSEAYYRRVRGGRD